MELYIFGHDHTLAGVVDAYEYLRWTRRYSQCGSFELKVDASSDNAALLVPGNILWKTDDEEAGIIEYVRLSETDRETIEVNGRFATSMLARRIIWGIEMLSGELSVCVGQLLDNHIIDPTDIARKIDGIAFDSDILSVTVNSQVSYKNLMDAIIDLCEAADIGIKTVFNPGTGISTVQLYRGSDSQAVFSKEYESLAGQSYTQSDADYANTVLVSGEGEGSDRMLVTVGGSFGEDRREIFVDAKDLRSEDFGGDYTDALTFRGQARLSELAPVHSFDASVNPYGSLTYKTDYDIGQTVRVVSKKWGVTLNTRITEIDETYDSDGRTIDVTFGKGLLTLSQKLKEGE
jgi:hypothetical protein